MLRVEKFLILTICCVFLVLSAAAQTQDSYEYQSEFIWGINKNTSGTEDVSYSSGSCICKHNVSPVASLDLAFSNRV